MTQSKIVILEKDLPQDETLKAWSEALTALYTKR